MCLGLLQVEKFSSTAGYCDGGEWSGEEVEAQSQTIFETFFLSNSPATDIISNHGVYDDGWMVQQLFPGQTENPQTESERQTLANLAL